MKQYIVDAFTGKPFTGNPAAVCVMDSWPSEGSMMKLAMENNLSETAFIVKEEAGYHLRWFTPGTEVELCGHATLASSFVILNYYEPQSQSVRFNTLSGVLTVNRKGDLYEMNFPTFDQPEIPVTDDMEKAFGARPSKAILGMDLVCIFDDEDTVRTMEPDQALLMKLPGRLQNVTAPRKDAACSSSAVTSATAPGTKADTAPDTKADTAPGTPVDCVSRSFGPKVAVPEDPVCGSAHCQIADYWSKVLGKKDILAYQASKRGGYLHCELPGEGRINLSGEAVLVAVSEILAELE